MSLERVFSIKIDGLDVVIKNLTDAEKAAEALRKQADELEAELSSIEVGTPEYVSLSNALDTITSSIIEVESEILSMASGIAEIGKDATNSFGQVDTAALATKKEVESANDAIESGFDKSAAAADQLSITLDAAKKELSNISVDTKGIKELENELSDVQDQIEVINDTEISPDLDLPDGDALDNLDNDAKSAIVTIGSLEEKAAELTEELKNIAIGTDEFISKQNELNNVNKKLEVINMSAEDQAQIFRDLGTSVTAAFAAGTGLAASFAAENEDAQKAILLVQQAMAAVEVISQISDAAKLARQAQIVASTNEQIASANSLTQATEEQSASTEKLNDATNKTSTANEVASKSTKGFTGSIRAMGVALLANPIFLITTIIVGIGLAINELSKRFEFFADIVESVEDALGGITGGFKVLKNNAEQTFDFLTQAAKTFLSAILEPFIFSINQLIKGFNLLGGSISELENPLGSVSENMGDLAKQGLALADAVADGYEAGVKRTQRLRELFQKEELLKVKQQANLIKEAELGSTRSAEDAKRKLKLESLQEERDISLERLKLENDLTNEEVAIIRSGNTEKIKEIKKLVNARGEVNQEILDSVTDFAAKEVALIQEQEAAKLAAIADRIVAIDNALKVEQAALSKVDNLRNKELTTIKTFAAEREKLELQRRAGEFKNAEEFNKQLQLLEIQRDTELKAIEIARAEFRKGLNDIQRNEAIAQIEFETNLRREAGELSFETEKEAINQIRELRLASLLEEEALLNVETEAGLTRLKEIEAERRQIARETTEQIKTAAIDAINLETQQRNNLLDITQAQIELEIQRQNISSKEGQEILRKSTLELETQKMQAIDLQRVAQSYEQTQILINEQATFATAEVEKRLEAELKTIELERQRINIAQTDLQSKRELGIISQKDFETQQKSLELQKEALNLREQESKIQAQIEVEIITDDAEAQGRAAGEAFISGLSNYLANPLDAEMNQFLTDTFGQAAGLVKELGGAVFGQLQELGNQLLENQKAKFDAQILAIDEQITAIDERINATNTLISESLANISNLETEAAEAQGGRREAILSQIEAERNAQANLTEQLKGQDAERKKAENERIKIEERKRKVIIQTAKIEKAIGIAQAVANTALGITNTIATVPKFDFGISTGILVALYAALGAAQVATIAAQPLPTGAKGGILGEKGEGIYPVKYAKGGVVQGKPHSLGGVKGTGAFNNVEVEGNEMIINKQATARNMPALSKINNEGKHKSFKVYEAGGILSSNISQSISSSNSNYSNGYFKFQSGGLIPQPSSEISQTISDNSVTERIKEVVTNIQAIDIKPVVAVTDINEASNRVSVVDVSNGF